MRNKLNKKVAFGLTLAVLVALLLAPLALADNVQNDVVAGGNDTITAGGSTTVNYRIAANSGDGQAGCNAADGTAATVTIDAPAGVIATPGSLTFTSCATDQPVVFSSTTPGDYEVTASVSDSGTGTYNTNPAKFTLHVLEASTPIDETPPSASPTQSPAANASGWNNSDVTVTWNWADDEDGSGIDVDNCTLTSTSSGEGEIDLSASCTDLAGNTGNASYTVKVDQTAPTFPDSCPAGGPFLLNSGSHSVGPISVNATISGLNAGASTLTGLVDASSVGVKNVSFTAVDNAGNSATKSCSYNVTYNFLGFSSPVDNPTVMNVAKAGQAIPLKWRLLDADNNPITNLASVGVTAASLSCTAGTTGDQVEEYATGSSGLQNLGDGYYQFNWKTPSAYANSCKTLHLNLGEGSTRTALFQFKK